MVEKNSEILQSKLEQLKLEHRDLDEVINKISEDPYSDQIQVQRLKKRKLTLKDQILKMENGILPDIIA